MPLNSLRKSRDEFKQAIATEEGIDVKAAAYLRELKRYRTFACNNLIEKDRSSRRVERRLRPA